MAVASMSEPRAKMGLLVHIRYHLFSKQSVSFVRKVALPSAVSLNQRITSVNWCFNAIYMGKLDLRST